jgi:hypothetical protein
VLSPRWLYLHLYIRSGFSRVNLRQYGVLVPDPTLFRANTRNAVVPEKYLRQKGAVALKAQGQAAIDLIDPDEYDMQKQGGGGLFGGKSKQADVESGDILQKNRPDN